MDFSHLHAVCRDAPFRILEIDFGPASSAKLDCAHERQQDKFKAAHGCRIAAVGAQSLKKAFHFALGQGFGVLSTITLDGPLEWGGRVRLRSQSGNGKPVDSRD